jgi:hypothetical protein
MTITPQEEHVKAQQRAQLGGLHKSSIGSFYPWAVVGRGLDGKWEVHNLQDGTGIFWDGKLWQGSCSAAVGLAGILKYGIEHLTGYSIQKLPPTEHELALQRRLQEGYGAGSYSLRAREALVNLGERLPPISPEVD